MVKVTAVNIVKAGCVEDFLAVAKELVEKTNALDKGCIKYELCKNLNDPLCYVMLEDWEDQASLDGHMSAKHFVELIPKMVDLSSQPTAITILEKVF